MPELTLAVTGTLGTMAFAGFADPANRILVISAGLVAALIIVLALIARAGLGDVPSGMGAVFEFIFDFVSDAAESMMGRVGRRYVPFCMSIFLFVLLCNWSSLLPVPAIIMEPGSQHGHSVFECPSTSYSTTLALALISFLAFNFYGLRKCICGTNAPEDRDKYGHDGKGFLGIFTWLKHFLNPVPSLWHELEGALRWMLLPCLAVLFTVINIIEEVARLVSLSVRLYGNIHGEHEVKLNLFSNLSLQLDAAKAFLAGSGTGGLNGVVSCVMVLLLWGTTFFVSMIGTLAGFIQAIVFFMLTMTYISHVAIDEH